MTNEELTLIYNEANNIRIKNPPLSTERIFAAMRACYDLGRKSNPLDEITLMKNQSDYQNRDVHVEHLKTRDTSK